jgi:exopolyphosphatase/guanosine-5'-triphosphate,3'-diphosphate pyrophosphatase
MRIAVIDLGTNTVRLLVGEPDGAGSYRPIYTTQEITRLGQGLLPNRMLQPEPIRRTLDVLRRFRQTAESHAASRIAVVGTSALREAKNREAFVACARPSWGSARHSSSDEDGWWGWTSAAEAPSSSSPMDLTF